MRKKRGTDGYLRYAVSGERGSVIIRLTDANDGEMERVKLKAHASCSFMRDRNNGKGEYYKSEAQSVVQ